MSKVNVLRCLWRRRFVKHGYELRREVIANELTGEDMCWTMAYTLPGGDWIGEPGMARMLCVKRGIRPIRRTARSSVCSIGRSVKDGKWYGWSHRAIRGFRTRGAAERFAESVS